MASQLGSAVTPAGHQAYESLLSQEQFGRGLGQQAMNQQQQMALAQQQMAQDQDTNAQRMAQQQDQFNVGIQQAQLDREQQMRRDASANQFAVQQDETQRKWADARYQKDQNFQIQLQQIELAADEAKARGQQDVFAQLIGTRQSAMRAKASNAAEVALVTSLQGKTAKQAQQILNSYAQHIEQAMSSAQHDQELSKNFAPSLRSAVLNESSESSRAVLDDLYFRLPYIGPGLSTEKALSDAGQLRGLEFMSLSPNGAAFFEGFDPSRTMSSYLVDENSKVDAATMTKMMQDRLVSGALKTLRSMPLKNFDEKTAEQALRLAMSTGDRSQVTALATKAGVSPTTLRHLLSSFSREFDVDNPKGVIADWQQRNASEIERSGPQLSLVRMAMDAERESYKVASSLARTASNAFETGNDFDSLEAGLGVAKRLMQNMTVGELATAESALRKAGVSQDEIKLLRGRLEESEGLEPRLRAATQGLEQSATEDQLLPLMLQGAMGGVDLAGIQARRAGLGGLVGKTGE